jgi:hypothetical protein
MKKWIILLAILSITGPGQVVAGSNPSAYDSPYAETRLWCPDDIEAYYQEMRASELRNLPQRDEVQMENEESARAFVEEHPFLGLHVKMNLIVWEYLGSMVEVIYVKDSELMRKVAYNILRDWPAAALGVTPLLNDLKHWDPENTDHYVYAGNEKSYGKDALRDMWRQWRREWNNIRSEAMGGYDNAAIDALVREFASRWGMDPENGYTKVPEPPVPDDWLPEDVNCTWYLCVEMERDDYDYHAVFLKKGPLFGDWNGSNTEVVSHFASSDDGMQGPYPGELGFSFPWDSKYIHFTESSYYTSGRRFRWLRATPRPYSGRPGIIGFDVKYPIRKGDNYESPEWIFGTALVASAPGSEFWEIFDKIKNLNKLGEKIGEEFRTWSGEFEPSE